MAKYPMPQLGFFWLAEVVAYSRVIKHIYIIMSSKYLSHQVSILFISNLIVFRSKGHIIVIIINLAHTKQVLLETLYI